MACFDLKNGNDPPDTKRSEMMHVNMVCRSSRQRGARCRRPASGALVVGFNTQGFQRMQDHRLKMHRECHTPVHVPQLVRGILRLRCDSDVSGNMRSEQSHVSNDDEPPSRDCHAAPLTSRPIFAMLPRVGPRSVSVGMALPLNHCQALPGIQGVEIMARSSSEPIGARSGLESSQSEV